MKKQQKNFRGLLYFAAPVYLSLVFTAALTSIIWCVALLLIDTYSEIWIIVIVTCDVLKDFSIDSIYQKILLK